MKLLLLVALLCVGFVLSGCSGVKITVNPEPSMVTGSNDYKCGSVALKETRPSLIFSPAGNLVPDFARALERSGMFENVYYPSRPDDKVDLVLDAKFDLVVDPHGGSLMAKSFLTGLLLFIPEPFIWYDIGYNANGQVDLLKDKALIATSSPRVDSEISLKFLSMFDLQQLQSEIIVKVKDSLYKQAINDLSRHCQKK